MHAQCARCTVHCATKSSLLILLGFSLVDEFQKTVTQCASNEDLFLEGVGKNRLKLQPHMLFWFLISELLISIEHFVAFFISQIDYIFIQFVFNYLH